jgi:hypothetical protein
MTNQTKMIEKIFYLLSLQLNKEKEKMKAELVCFLKEINENSYEVFEIGSILFLIGEYVRTFKDKEIGEEYKKQLDQLLKIYDFKFYKEEKNPIYKMDKKVYTSTLGAIYGGLRNINNYLKRDDISLNIREIRKYVFAHVLDGATVANANKDKEITFDILLACQPFGLFEPEDLVLVEAVKVLKEKSKETKNTFEWLLLAYYYAEQGSYHLTKELMKKAKSIEFEDQSSQYLYDIVYRKLEHKSQLQEYMIIHRPFGNNNIYEPGCDERFPKKVKPTDSVVLKALTWPIHESMDVYVKLYVNDTERVYKGKYVAEPEKHFEWEIGNFRPLDKISYQFYFTTDSGKDITTEKFDFDVLKGQKIESIDHISATGKTLEVKYRSDNDKYDMMWIDLHDNGDFSLHTDQNCKQKEKLTVDQKEEVDIELVKEVDCYVAKWKDSTVRIYKEPFRLMYKGKGQVVFHSLCKWIDTQGRISIIEMDMDKEAKEKFYGFGERYNELNQAGNSPDVFVYNQYKEQGLKTYMPIPFYISSLNYGLFIESSCFVQFDMGETDEERIQISCEADTANIHVFAGQVRDIIMKYTDKTGKPKMIPKWALGPWMSSNNWDSQEEVLKQLALTKQYDIPATVLVIEAWSDEVTYYVFNDAKYKEKPSREFYGYDDYEFPEWGRWPNPKEMVETLHNEGNVFCGRFRF